MALFSSTDIELLIDLATSDENLEPNWATNTEIVDAIRMNETRPYPVCMLIQQKIFQRNPMVSLLALTLLDCCIQNCGEPFCDEVFKPSYLRELAKLVKQKGRYNEKVIERIMQLIVNWKAGFEGDPRYGNSISQAYDSIKVLDLPLPAPTITSATYSIARSPDWVMSNNCANCRLSFSTFNRRHHCRNCGRTFCQACSSNTRTIPEFGYEKPVRVCDACNRFLVHKKSNAAHLPSSVSSEETAPPNASLSTEKPNHNVSNPQITGQQQQQPHPREQDEEDPDLAKAIAESLKEAYMPSSFGSLSISESTDDAVAVSANGQSSFQIPSAQSIPAYSHPICAPSKVSTTISTPDQPLAFAHQEDPATKDDAEDAYYISLWEKEIELFHGKISSYANYGINIRLNTSLEIAYKSTFKIQEAILKMATKTSDQRLNVESKLRKLEHIVEMRRMLIEARRKAKEEDELLKRMQLEQKMALLKQQNQQPVFMQTHHPAYNYYAPNPSFPAMHHPPSTGSHGIATPFGTLMQTHNNAHVYLPPPTHSNSLPQNPIGPFSVPQHTPQMANLQQQSALYSVTHQTLPNASPSPQNSSQQQNYSLIQGIHPVIPSLELTACEPSIQKTHPTEERPQDNTQPPLIFL